MQGLKSAILAIFRMGRETVPCQCGHQESLTGVRKLFLLWVPMTPQKDCKAKLERPYFFKVQSGKIPVCTTYVKGDILAASALYGALRHWGTILAYRTTGPVEDLKIWKGVYQRPKHSAEAKGFHYLDISFGCRSY